jgi:hypothetical protein
MNNTLSQYFYKLSDVDKFSDWIWQIVSYFNNPILFRDIKINTKILRIVKEYGTTIEGLTNIYEEYVPMSKRLLFREAIGYAIRNHANDQSADLSDIEDLLYLMANIKAYESIQALIPLNIGSYFGRIFPEIIFDSIAVLKYLAPSEKVFVVMRQIIDNNDFDENYLFEALKALIECHPEITPEIIIDYEPRLTALYNLKKSYPEDLKIFQESAVDWAKFTISHTSSRWIKEYWEKSSHINRQLWLFDLFFNNPFLSFNIAIDKFDDDEIILRYQNKTIQISQNKKYNWTVDRIKTQENAFSYVMLMNRNLLEDSKIPASVIENANIINNNLTKNRLNQFQENWIVNSEGATTYA